MESEREVKMTSWMEILFKYNNNIHTQLSRYFELRGGNP